MRVARDSPFGGAEGWKTGKQAGAFSIGGQRKADASRGSTNEGKTPPPDFQRGWVWDNEHVRSLPVSFARAQSLSRSARSWIVNCY
jgi:hypothetical protein